MASSTFESTYQQSPEDGQKGKNQAKEQDGLIHHSGSLDKMKNAGKTVLHGAEDLAHKGLDKGKELAHSKAGQKIGHEVVATGKEIGEKNVHSVKGVMEAGKHGDIGGVIRHAAPLVGEAALGPQGMVLKIAKDKALQAAEEHVQSRGQSQKTEHVEPSHKKSDAKTERVLPHITIVGDDDGKKRKVKH